MAYFDDFALAVHKYPNDHVSIKVDIVDLTEPNINATEVFTFKVRVTNDGPLHLKNVVLMIDGSDFVRISKSMSPPEFETTFLSSSEHVAAGSGRTFGKFFGKARKITGSTPQPLVTAKIYSWEADLSSLLTSVASGPTAMGSYMGVVHEP